jgi:hypothetical protein
MAWDTIRYFIMKTFVKKTNSFLSKEMRELRSDIIYIRDDIIRLFKKVLTERYFILGLIIGLVLHFVF